MEAILLILASVMALEALAFLLIPVRVKRWVQDLSPTELWYMGLLELLIAGVVIYYAVSNLLN